MPDNHRTVYWYRGQVRESLDVAEQIKRIDPREDVTFELTLPLDMGLLPSCPVLLMAGLVCLIGAAAGGYGWIPRGLGGPPPWEWPATAPACCSRPAGSPGGAYRRSGPFWYSTWACFGAQAAAIVSVVAAAGAGGATAALWALATIGLLWALLVERAGA